MPGIGIVTNPHSRRNRRFPERMRRLGYILGQDDHYQLTNRIDDIRYVAEQFKKHEIDILALNGGDGTNHVTLSSFIDVYQDTPLPKIAFLRGGTMNTISSALGITGTPQSLLANLVEKYYTNQNFESTECDMLRVRDADADHYGFIFGNGIVTNFLNMYYHEGNPSPMKAVSLLTQAIGGLPFGGRLIKEIIKPFNASIDLETKHGVVNWKKGDYTAVIAATVPQIGLGFRPFIRAEEQPHTFHILGLHGTKLQTVEALPKIRLGMALSPKVALSEVASVATISSDEPIEYTIDGEMHLAKGDVELSTGPRIEVIIK